jgi:hypothetical protein
MTNGRKSQPKRKTPHRLHRETFTTSRLLEFCSVKELINVTGHDTDEWPLVILKEIGDNALDNTEEAEVAPVIDISIDDDKIMVQDNGSGMRPETVTAILDYSSRTSSREAYCSPTRGQQGNALSSILAMTYALDYEERGEDAVGETVIEAHGVSHVIQFGVDRLRQRPKITHSQEPSIITTGTRITVRWPDSARSTLVAVKPFFLQMADDFTWLNPHLTLSLVWQGEPYAVYDDGSEGSEFSVAASDPDWRKWRPSDPTSPHWYDATRLQRLMAAYIALDLDRGRPPRTVREFVSEFRGLSGTAKQRLVLEAVGASRLPLKDFFEGGDIARLLAAMQDHSRPVKPRDLGLIGRDHLLRRFEKHGVDPATFSYKKSEVEYDGVPYMIEFAFGYCPDDDDGKTTDENDGERERRRIVCGINWSVTVGANPFRALGSGGVSLDTLLAQERAGADEPIVTVLHVACPRVSYLDRGKSSVAVPGGRTW